MRVTLSLVGGRTCGTREAEELTDGTSGLPRDRQDEQDRDTASAAAPARGRHVTARLPAIGDYAFVSDCQSAALISRDGSVDWWCVPRFDSPSVFGRLLGENAGHWSLQPSAAFQVDRQYLEDSLVLRTVFTTAAGAVTVTDALGLELGARGHEIGMRSPHVLLRRVEGSRGAVEMATELAPRMEYGLTVPHVAEGKGAIIARGGPVRLALSGPVALAPVPGQASGRFTVRAGERVDFALTYTPSSAVSDGTAAREPATLEDTIVGWQSWAELHDGYDGRHRAAVRRSSLVLQGLTFQPTGAVVAAATTSLPEKVGGALNFDYRFAWLRDLSLTIRSLWIAACPDEADRLFRWIADAGGHLGDERVQIMYGVEGERNLAEHELDHLPGFRGSRPVRVGNAAWDQQQLDVLGEVLDAAEQLREQLGELEEPTRQLLVTLAERAAATWREPDAGMWEARDRERQYVSSKVMCWVALDRAIRLAPLLGDGIDLDRWQEARERVRTAVLTKGWSTAAGAYTGAFGSDDLDASVLLLPLVRFLPADDERMWATIEAVERELGDVGLVRRWPEDPMGFLICTFWLVECLALGGEIARAETWFARATSYANDLGLMSEEADPDRKELLGNYPQAFSHVGLINAAWRLTQNDQSAKERP
ncbi:MAG: Glucoamylase [uncultured Solirubrobacteraceae bacterium]|uniref:Glucoamylase n=1 Tax=uncultured Solirubrobacteraceae bacterium TaxID=1162706 RepID=A0A6J4SF26_9ACTN|nr:MAG: Glucoamylase [uncultured Solirubrobacteraceae bacterium]